ncbi:uncharacterized protein EV422DRAFT_523279 [Fimicolochytrium jonesii]|uniref:uncharacterized protein n=1 Tax=Fimicolochytrium jonesii TaxID=1396493 RepID=UPI0022FEB5CA|nr:uncharacterized protein EV422DRAFT_523279 [Fimicolochytrium jonesii]KAI8823081.1 hypothetical protein EV422DRAFT_523279 [Fimicolochytrium jonesii]
MSPPSIANPTYKPIPHPATGSFPTFQAFWPFYLGEHANKTCRRLHLTGTTFVIGVLATAITTLQPRLLIYVPLIGYGFAWVGHFFFEHNKPATFKYPVWSLMSDFKLWWEVATLKRAF